MFNYLVMIGVGYAESESMGMLVYELNSEKDMSEEEVRDKFVKDFSTCHLEHARNNRPMNICCSDNVKTQSNFCSVCGANLHQYNDEDIKGIDSEVVKDAVVGLLRRMPSAQFEESDVYYYSGMLDSGWSQSIIQYLSPKIEYDKIFIITSIDDYIENGETSISESHIIITKN